MLRSGVCWLFHAAVGMADMHVCVCPSLKKVWTFGIQLGSKRNEMLTCIKMTWTKKSTFDNKSSLVMSYCGGLWHLTVSALHSVGKRLAN